MRSTGVASVGYGVGAGAAVWAASVWALVLSMRSGIFATALARRQSSFGAAGHFGHLPAGAAMWAVLFAALQVAAVLVFAYSLRVRLRMSGAASFAAGGVAVMLADAAGLLGLLVFLRLSVGVA